MKKLFIVAIALIPSLSFGQLTNDDKKDIENFAVDMCECLNDMFDELDPVVIDFLEATANEGEEAANQVLMTAIAESTEEEQASLMASFQKMQDPEFLGRIEKCVVSGDISEELKAELDKENSEASKYAFEVFKNNKECRVAKLFYEVGTKEE